MFSLDLLLQVKQEAETMEKWFEVMFWRSTYASQVVKLHASCEQLDNMVIGGHTNDGRTYIDCFPNIYQKFQEIY